MLRLIILFLLTYLILKILFRIFSIYIVRNKKRFREKSEKREIIDIDYEEITDEKKLDENR